MTVKYNYQMTDADIVTGTKSVGTRTATLRKNIHQIMVSIVYRWAQSGDASAAAGRAAALLQEVDSYTAQAVINWFKAYGDLDYDKEEETFSYNGTTVSTDVFQAAKEEPYWKLTPPSKPQPAFDLNARLMQLVKSAQKKREKGLKEGDSVPVDMLEALSAIAEGNFHMEDTE